MKRRLFVMGLGTGLGEAGAAGLSVNGIGFVDGLKLDRDTRAATLLLIIDRPLEDGLTKPRVRSKLLAYHDWVFVDRKLTKMHPGVDLAAGVGVLFLHPEPTTALARSVLDQLAGYAKELQFLPTLKVWPAKS